MDEVIEDRCEAWSALAEERRIDLHSESFADHPVVPLVPGDLDQIVDNLLANAVDASPEGGRIRVQLGRRRRRGGWSCTSSTKGPA